MKPAIRLIYLYLFSFIGLVVVVTGLIRLIDLGLKTAIFKGSDVYSYAVSRKIDCPPGEKCVESNEDFENEVLEEAKRQRQRNLSSSLSMIIVGVPLYLYHWNIIKKEGSSAKSSEKLSKHS